MKDKILENIIEHLLNDEKPSIFLNNIKDELSNTSLKLLVQLEETEQEKEHHPEGNVWNHVMLVVDIAAKVKDLANDKESFMLAALFHDIGKKETTKKNKKGRLISYNHDTIGAERLNDILYNYLESIHNVDKIKNLVKYHMHHLYIIKNLPFGNTEKMIKDVDINDMLLLFFCDKLGRGKVTTEMKDKVLKDLAEIENILNNTYKVSVKDLNVNLKEKIKDI